MLVSFFRVGVFRVSKVVTRLDPAEFQSRRFPTPALNRARSIPTRPRSSRSTTSGTVGSLTRTESVGRRVSGAPCWSITWVSAFRVMGIKNVDRQNFFPFHCTFDSLVPFFGARSGLRSALCSALSPCFDRCSLGCSSLPLYRYRQYLDPSGVRHFEYPRIHPIRLDWSDRLSEHDLHLRQVPLHTGVPSWSK